MIWLPRYTLIDLEANSAVSKTTAVSDEPGVHENIYVLEAGMTYPAVG